MRELDKNLRGLYIFLKRKIRYNLKQSRKINKGEKNEQKGIFDDNIGHICFVGVAQIDIC